MKSDPSKFRFTFPLRGRLLLAASIVTLVSAAGVAQYADQNGGQPGNNQGDPPSRVARVAVIQGNVSLEPAGVDAFSAAEINYPLTAGDRVYADNSSFSELQTAGLAVRLGNGADLTLSSLTDSVAQFGLAQGSIRLRTRDLTNPDGSQSVVEVDTPNGAVLVQRPGDIRVDSYPQDDTTVVTVSSGSVEVTGNGFDQTLGPNQSLRLAGNPVYLEPLRLLPADALDQFDAARERERQQAFAVSGQYVDPGMVGAGDLDQYGDWAPNPDYGAVWFPRQVAADWAPYRNGHWAWVAPWGWTWVEAEPWGFAPFHYGRWASFDGRWGWVPGPPPSVFGGRAPRPVYSPALVAFVGGPRFSVSIGLGGAPGAGVTAWFPLGPREAYTPWYHASPGYVNRVNVTNLYNRNVTEVRNTYINRTTNVYNTNVTNVTYVNRPQATTALPQRDFAAGRRVDNSQRVQLDPATRRQLDQAPVLPHPLVTPTAAMAAPQAPARALPPLQARPILESGRLSRSGANVPANMIPVNPVTTPVQHMPDPDRSAPVQLNPGVNGGRSNLYRPQPIQEGAVPGTVNGTDGNAGERPSRGNFPQQRPAQVAPQPAQPAQPVQNQPVHMAPRPPEQQRPLVNRTVPQQQQPPFAQQQQAIERHDPGRPLGPQQVDNLRQGRPAGPATQPEPVQHPAPVAPGKPAPAIDPRGDRQRDPR